ncbi:MAG: helix-turn-helix transcriptional regulator, partial [Clostridia bacterium]|nr:helix-turn-helix transcriptional regulator [Clostridia bacterium]
RLEKDGLISSYWGDENQGARRRYYTLTPRGQERLMRDRRMWLETREILDKLIGDETDA